MHASENSASQYQAPAPQASGSAASTVLAWIAFLLPTVGVPGEMLLQDTLKSAVLAFGMLIAACFFVWHQRKHNTLLHWHGLLAIPLVLMVYALGSMVWSHTYLAGVEAIRWFLLSLLLFLGLNTLRQDHLPKLLWGLHAGALVASVWAASQFWGAWNLFPQAAVPASSFANRNFFAEYAVAALPLSVWLLVRLSASRYLVWVALSVAFNLVAILMTGTRSALIALGLVLPCLVVVIARYRTQLPCGRWGRGQLLEVGLALALGVAVLGNLPSGNTAILQEGTGATPLQRSVLRTNSMAQGTEYTQGTFSVRTAMWLATARMLVANPWTGVGAGAWEVQIPLYQRIDTTLETDYHAHNESLQLLSEYGLVVGGLCLAFLWAYLIKVAAATWQASGPALQEAPLRAFVLTSLLAQLIVSNAGFPWHLAGGGMLLALCLGLLARSDLRLGDQAAARAHGFGVSARTLQAAGVGLACCVVVASGLSVQALRAERKLVSGITLANGYARAARAGSSTAADLKDQALQLAREGIAINPHYRKLTAEIAAPFAAQGDWHNAVWMLESLTASRPHLSALWTDLARGYSILGQHVQAEQAWAQVQRLKPEALSTATLHATLLAQAGRGPEAAAVLEQHFEHKAFDWDMVQAGYEIGYKTQNWALAIQSLELRNSAWPEQTADGFFRLGKLYAEPQVNQPAKALAAFLAGLAKVPKDQKPNYLIQIPSSFREQM